MVEFSIVTTRKISNPLALAVLACLFERPMHPYEMAVTMRERHKDESIKLNYGSLYAIVESMQKRKLIEEQETEREGNRPERTVYRLTEAGRFELLDWLSELLCRPVKEYTQFEAGLCLLPVLPPGQAIDLLKERCDTLGLQIEEAHARADYCRKAHLPRLFFVESEYKTKLLEAELAWVRRLVTEIESGKLEGMAEWRKIHPGERHRGKERKYSVKRAGDSP
jgi:DNA-binding PadR family transcriptional regulator